MKAPDPVPERYWRPELPASGSPGSPGSSGGTASGTASGTPALNTSSRQQATRRGAAQQQQQRSASPPPQRRQQQQRPQQQQWQQQAHSQRGQGEVGRAWETAAPGGPTVWSDDAALLLVDYRPQPAASAASSPPSGPSGAAPSNGSSSSGSGSRGSGSSLRGAATAAATAAPAPQLEQRLASLEHKLETITELLTEVGLPELSLLACPACRPACISAAKARSLSATIAMHVSVAE